MFMDLERVLPDGVRVLSIQPELVKGNIQVKLAIATTSDEAKLKFLRTLEASKVFTRMELLNEHAPQGPSQGNESVVNLQVIYSRT